MKGFSSFQNPSLTKMKSICILGYLCGWLRAGCGIYKIDSEDAFFQLLFLGQCQTL